MTNQFDSYEGFKIACLTCSRTLNEIDGIEVSSKLLWSILAMYQAIIYAMLSNKEVWTVEENPDYNNDLLNSIMKSAQAAKDIKFVKQYLGDEEEKQKIDDIQLIRHNVIHANSAKLKEWESNMNYLRDLLALCLKIAFQICEANENHLKDEKSKKMRQFCHQFQEKMLDRLNHYPQS